MSFFKFSLKQSFNIPGVKKAFNAFLDPSLIIPQIRIDHINQLNFVSLKEKGITCVIFDKDQTLSVTYVDQLHPSCLDHINQARQMFPNAVAILSNSVGSCDDDGYRGAMETEKHMNLPVIRHRLKKPSCLPEVLEHFQKTSGRIISPNEICMVGDRVLTDIMFGNEYGMLR